jgi:hypothetical protein
VSDHGILDKTMLGKLLVAKIALHECKLLLWAPVSLYICTYIHTHAHICTRAHILIHACTQAHVHMHMYVCTCTHIYLFIYLFIYFWTLNIYLVLGRLLLPPSMVVEWPTTYIRLQVRNFFSIQQKLFPPFYLVTFHHV